MIWHTAPIFEFHNNSNEIFYFTLPFNYNNNTFKRFTCKLFKLKKELIVIHDSIRS